MANATTENRLLGHYRLLAQIGSGGMGAVYRAYDEHLDRDVAVKVLPSSAAVGKGFDSKAQRALRQEALTLSRLNHPNIAQVYDLDKESDTDFIVMELVPGESLAQRLGDGPLSQDELLSIMTQTLHGLAAAHAQGIIHRDVKPAEPANHDRWSRQNSGLWAGTVRAPRWPRRQDRLDRNGCGGNFGNHGLHVSGTVARRTV